MFDLSFWEIVVIAVVAIIVVGPERLPALAYTVGQWIARVRRFVANAKAEMESEFNTAELRRLLNAQEEEMQRLRRLLEDTRQEIAQEGRRLTEDLEQPEGTTAKPALSGTSHASQGTPPTPRTLEEEMQALSQKLGEPLHRPNFGGDTPSEPIPSAPSGAKQA
ncbi:MAG: Sec-independent protein translocase protein TatB [Halothiobacillaceae bacterium]